MATVSYAIVSHHIRRDVHDPLRFFEVLKPIHFFQHAPYADMASAEMADAIRFKNPLDLYRRLSAMRPDIVQGGEPFVRRLVPAALAVTAYARVHRRPYVVPSLENLPPSSKYGTAWATALRGAIRPYLRGATLDIAVNEGAEKNFLWGGAPSGRVARMMYGTWGVDTAEFSPEGPREQLPGNGPWIVFLGRIHREKGVFDLVDAMPRVLEHAAADLVFIGDGPDLAGLQSAAGHLKGNVHFLGAVKNHDVPRYLRPAAMLVAPSITTPKWAEQVGMSAIQALACGVPVVTTRSGSIPEFIDDEVTGVLVDESDPPALAAAIVRFLNNDNVRAEFAKRARDEAVRRFDARSNIRAIERKILEACGYS